GDTERIVAKAVPNGARWAGRGQGGDFDGCVAVELADPRQFGGLLSRIVLPGPSIVALPFRARGPLPCPVKRTALPPGEMMGIVVLATVPGRKDAVAAAATGRGAAAVGALLTDGVIVQIHAGGDAALRAAMAALAALPDVTRARSAVVVDQP
ncbi:MAG: hypothetical protein H0V04_05980, partial [Chloroflexi bacterium]|nr:hypothetical protein [Chloroflexota bacterium]